MNPLDFDVTREAIDKADRDSSISQTGYYEGTMTMVRYERTQSGAGCVVFDFESKGSTAKGIKLFIIGKDGQEIFGYDIFQSFALCVGVKKVQATQLTIPLYNYEQKKDINTSAYVYRDLIKKPIGVILQKEEYSKENGDIGFRLNIKHFFNANTKQTAGEIINQKEAVKYTQLKDKYSDILTSNSPQSKNNPPSRDNTTFQKYDELEVETYDELIPF